MEEDRDTKAHPDARQDASEIQAHLDRFTAELSPILEQMAQKLNEHDGHISRHEGHFKELKDGYTKHQVSGLRSRHEGKLGELISKLGEAHKHLGGKEGPDDFWPALHSKMQEMNVGPDKEDEFMGHVHNHLTKTHESMRASLGDMLSPAAAGSDVGSGTVPNEKPAASVEVKAEGEPRAVAKGVEKASKEVKKVVEKEPVVGSAEFFKNAKKGSSSAPKAHK
jgi:hypothetical protein